MFLTIGERNDTLKFVHKNVKLEIGNHYIELNNYFKFVVSLDLPICILHKLLIRENSNAYKLTLRKFDEKYLQKCGLYHINYRTYLHKLHMFRNYYTFHTLCLLKNLKRE